MALCPRSKIYQAQKVFNFNKRWLEYMFFCCLAGTRARFLPHSGQDSHFQLSVRSTLLILKKKPCQWILITVKLGFRHSLMRNRFIFVLVGCSGEGGGGSCVSFFLVGYKQLQKGMGHFDKAEFYTYINIKVSFSQLSVLSSLNRCWMNFVLTFKLKDINIEHRGLGTRGWG